MSKKPALSGVTETMLQTIYARAKETKTRGAIKDSKAVEIIDSLDYDFSLADKDSAMHNGVIARTIVLDRLAGKFLRLHPGAVAVNIACGLDTRCYRMKGYSHWYNLDLPETIEVRRSILPPTEKITQIAMSAMDDWGGEVAENGVPALVIIEGLTMYLSEADVQRIFSVISARFGKAQVLVEVMNPAVAKRFREKSIEGSKAKFTWGVKNGAGESRVEVLKGISFGVEKGEFCVLLGPSGSGKSTLLNIIGGIDDADSGYISINGEKIENMKEKALTDYRRRHLGYIFQMYNLIPNLNIKENVETGAYLSDHPLDVDDILKTLGLYEHRHKLPSQLSGGQQQRCSIGRAIVKNPDILLCDEPTGALDYNTSKEILKLIETVNQKYSTTIIMVTHNEAIKDMADKVVKLRDGMIRRVIENDRKLTADELDW